MLIKQLAYQLIYVINTPRKVSYHQETIPKVRVLNNGTIFVPIEEKKCTLIIEKKTIS